MKNQIIGVWMLLFIAIPVVTSAQQDLTIEDAVMGRWGKLAPERMSNMAWIPETNLYSYVEKTDDGEVLVMVDANNFDKTEIVTSQFLGSNLMLKKPLARIPKLKWINTNEFLFVFAGMMNTYNRKSNTVEQLHQMPKGGANIVFRPNSTDFAYTKENNLFAMIDGKEVQITNIANKEIVSGQTVSRVEFGIEKGVIWSNSGKSLGFYQKDESQVTNYPLVNYSTRPATVKNTKYPMAGMASEKIKVGVFAIGSKEAIYLDAGEGTEQYLTSLAWGPKDNFVYIGHLNRGQDSFVMKQYSAKNGVLTGDIFSEEDKEYVHPTHSMNFVSKEDFLWISEKSGINQFYNYNVSGKANWQINTGDILVRSYVGYNAKSRKLWFMGNHKDKIDMHLFEVEIEDGGNKEVKQITQGDAYHSSVSMSSDQKFAFAQSSSLTTPNSYDLIELKKGSVSNIFTSENPLKDYKIGQTKMETLTAADGKTILHSRTILPYDFDETKKYPVLVYVYNGPGVQLLHKSWTGGAPLWMYHFANKGYIVYTLDGRGSTNRGIEFEQATFQNLGQVEMLDQLAGLDYLKTLDYVDTTRFGVHGWSYGGFMTTSLLTSYPGTFKVGAAGGPVMDWRYYEIMYTERYMDTPETNKAGYDLSSNLQRAQYLKDKLLIIHGTVDPTVVKQHSDLFLKECIKNGVQVDYFEYPGHEHNVYGKERVHLMTKILNYIEANL